MRMKKLKRKTPKYILLNMQYRLKVDLRLVQLLVMLLEMLMLLKTVNMDVMEEMEEIAQILIPT